MKKLKIKRIFLEVETNDVEVEPLVYFDEPITINGGILTTTEQGSYLLPNEENNKEFSFFYQSELKPCETKYTKTLDNRLATIKESDIINDYLKKDLQNLNNKMGINIEFEKLKNIVVFDVSSSHKIAVITDCVMSEDTNGKKTISPFTQIISIKHDMAYPFDGDFDDYDEDISEILDILKK